MGTNQWTVGVKEKEKYGKKDGLIQLCEEEQNKRDCDAKELRMSLRLLPEGVLCIVSRELSFAAPITNAETVSTCHVCHVSYHQTYL